MNVRCVIHVNLCVMSHTSLLVDLCASFEINDSQHSFWEVLCVSLALIHDSTYPYFLGSCDPGIFPSFFSSSYGICTGLIPPGRIQFLFWARFGFRDCYFTDFHKLICKID